MDYSVEAGENAVTELTARVFGHADDDIKIKEKVVLSGEKSRGLIKTRVALEDDAKAEVTGITEGNAAGSRGHVDCMEIVKDRAVAKAIPIVNVTNSLAKVTHEAAIGSVDKRQLEIKKVYPGPRRALIRKRNTNFYFKYALIRTNFKMQILV
jgi:Fe-S cluster assembly scaffold protein SufB